MVVTLPVVLVDGTVWSWGDNGFGQLGDGTTTERHSPVQSSLTGVAAIARGFDHSLVLVASSSTTTSYDCDRLYRLTSVDGPSETTSYEYDPVGNRLTKAQGSQTSYTYDRADRIQSAGATSYTVDANGNLTNRGSDTFAYDQANRLKTATIAGATSSYAYDGDGKRASKTVGTQTTSFVCDVNRDLPVILDDGTLKYVYGLGLAYAEVASGSLLVYHTA